MVRSLTINMLLICLVCMTAQCSRLTNLAKSEQQNNRPVPAISVWLTKGDKSVLLQKQEGLVTTVTTKNDYPLIIVQQDKKYQSIDGFGYTLTGGSAQLINTLNNTIKESLLNEVFGTSPTSIGVSYLRLSIGASDLDASVFSYNDIPDGTTDMELNHFSIEKEKKHLIPVLKKILSINPSIKIIAAPWSPPAWMKDNNHSIGGSLKPQVYDTYAKYFVKYIRAMKAEGITIDAITPQNEPLHPGNNPSLLMTAEQQRDFIKNNLGPAFKGAGISTKIVIYDHNLDQPDYPKTILNDAEAAQYVDGSAFHLYAGDVKTMSTIHDAFPEKNIYFTEQWTGAKSSFDGDLLWHSKNVIVGTMRNWSKIALEWNLASDALYNPHTPDGCTECKGALTIEGNNISKNVSYYIIAHASKFVPAGSVRIASSEIPQLSNVAFLTPAGKKVMIVANENETILPFSLKDAEQQYLVSVPERSVITIVWQ